MIRDAHFQDIPEITKMIHEMHAASKYAGRVSIHGQTLKELLMGAVMGQRRPGPQGSFIAVAEHGGKLTGFMVGVLDRVYHVGTKLTANDVFLHCRDTARPADALRLVAAYIAWAKANPNVIEIMLSWADTLPGAERVSAIYQRAGAEKVGEMWELRVDRSAERIAA